MTKERRKRPLGQQDLKCGSRGAPHLKVVGDPREVVSDREARYFGARVEEHSLVPLCEARFGCIGFDDWLRRSQTVA
jgi:hypothetical protein